MVEIKEAEDFKIDGLSVSFSLQAGMVKAVEDVSLIIPKNKVTSIIGESGCGKSILVQSILGVLPNYAIINGNIFYGTDEILNSKVGVLKKYIGKAWGLIPQLPGAAFSPVKKIGKHFFDVLEAAAPDKDKKIIEETLALFGLNDTKNIMQAYPHELSGGMLQRVLCAMAIIIEPQWVLADEPTKGLDEKNTLVAYNNLNKIKQDSHTSMLVITHDIKFAKDFSDFIVVMYKGEIMEVNSDSLTNPLHPYTQFFLRALPEYGFATLPAINISNENVQGCKFAPRCPYCKEICKASKPPLVQVGKNKVRCFLYA